MHPILQFIKDINDSCGDLILATLAGGALFYAIREHQGRNRPYISTKIEGSPYGTGIAFFIVLKNCGNQPAKIEIKELKFICGEETYTSKVEDRYFVTANEEIRVLVRDVGKNLADSYLRRTPKEEVLVRCLGYARSVYEDRIGSEFQVRYSIEFSANGASAKLKDYQTKKI